MKKAFAYIDGFNVYHSLFTFIKNNSREKHYLKWIDYKKLLHLFIDQSQETLEKIYIFTAPPKHLPQCSGKVERHEHYMRALQEYLDITVISGRFGKKTIKCAQCKESTLGHEEKETDVSIGIQVVHDILKETVEKIILVSGDTDFIPIITYVLKNTDREITVLNPLGQDKNLHFRNVINIAETHDSTSYKERFSHRQVKEQHMKISQLPHKCLLASGNSIDNPYISCGNEA